MADSAWIEAMQEELYRFDRLSFWELIDKPFGKSIIKLKWLWKNKKDDDQTVIRNKARLVAKGKRILKKKTKTKPKTIKPNTEWKRSKKTKSFEARGQQKSTPGKSKSTSGKSKSNLEKPKQKKQRKYNLRDQKCQTLKVVLHSKKQQGLILQL
nr:putative ribonuclease H-like domain-containing protein [Tanacetum cinerariifolium]